jgi:hypothetical protein
LSQRKKKRKRLPRRLERSDQAGRAVIRKRDDLASASPLNKGEGRVRVRRTVSKPELPIPSPQSSPLLQRGEADQLTLNPGSHASGPPYSGSRLGITSGFVLIITCFCVTSCTTLSSHEFSQPTTGWETKTGQLMYRSPKTTLIGDALVRFSKTGDFELTVSKGPGITLLSIRQDATFAEVKGAFARQGWSGLVAQAPPQLRGWLGLRDQFLRARDEKTLQCVSGNETFLFRF